jgi:hypothetical protein
MIPAPYRFLCQGLDLPFCVFCSHFKNGISRDMIAVETPDAYHGSRVRIYQFVAKTPYVMTLRTFQYDAHRTTEQHIKNGACQFLSPLP